MIINLKDFKKKLNENITDLKFEDLPKDSKSYLRNHTTDINQEFIIDGPNDEKIKAISISKKDKVYAASQQFYNYKFSLVDTKKKTNENNQITFDLPTEVIKFGSDIKSLMMIFEEKLELQGLSTPEFNKFSNDLFTAVFKYKQAALNLQK